MPDFSYDKRYPYVTFTNRQVSYSHERLSNWWWDELIQHRSRLIGCKVSRVYRNRLTTLIEGVQYTIKDLSENGRKVLIAENNRWYNCSNFYIYHRKNEPPLKWFKKFAKEFL